MPQTDNGDSGLITADDVIDRLAALPSLRPYAAFCVLPMVWLDDVGVRFRRSDLDAWIERESRRQRIRALSDQARALGVPAAPEAPVPAHDDTESTPRSNEQD